MNNNDAINLVISKQVTSVNARKMSFKVRVKVELDYVFVNGKREYIEN